MYSERVQKVLAKSGIEVGDTMEIHSQRAPIVGELMPRPDMGNENALVIKLDNGYNAGIEYRDGMKLKLLKKGTGMPKFASTPVRVKKGKPKVVMIYTGGTIGSKVDYKTGGVHMLIEPGELLTEVPELADIANIEIRHLFSIASEDLTHMEWKAMAKEVESAFKDGAKGVVITMGTDMMHYTAAALGFMLKNLNGPVVITGAQRSSDRGSSDAFLISAAPQRWRRGRT